MTVNPAVRPTAVAGLFYPDNAAELRAQLQQLLEENGYQGPAPKALIAPHAGYIYSGAVAARAYNALRGLRDTIQRVVLVGPAHRVALRGQAVPSVDFFRTPLGEVPLDREAIGLIEKLPSVGRSDPAHQLEHSLEVHLPFLQTLLNHFRLVPLLAGGVPPGEIARVLETLWGGRETLFIISSDLSHYHPYALARQLDLATARCIETLRIPIREHQACGADPINGLLMVARTHALHVRELDLRNSGDTAGDPGRVVGYGAWAFYEA